jgi:two-component system OmpR family sensor kinase
LIRRLSLRARLILGVIALTAIGLVAADIATYTSLGSFLIGRTDSSLDAAHVAVEGALLHHGRPRSSGQGGGVRQGDDGPAIGDLTAAAPGDYVELRTLNGRVVVSGLVPQFSGEEQEEPPILPSSIRLGGSTAQPGRDRVRYFTVHAKDEHGRYRVRASSEPQARNYVLLIAAPLDSVDTTLHRLMLIELLVTALVLLAIALLGLWVVRLGLRPLAAIGDTAAAIAAGDLTRRVERAEERTEVGRLGLALNAMLAQIESAFREREATEGRLRRFVADASHELRTPLAAVRAYAELFKRGASDRPDDLARSMRGIERESERMSLLVEDLLLLARLDEGRPLETKRVQLDELILEAVETAQTVEPDRPVDVELEPAVVAGDPAGLRQIIDNLLANVRAHTPPGTPARVTLARVNGNARIEVADSGPGIDEENLARLFERFHRADASRARASGGVGLGLSIVAAVAAAHEGTVSVDSAPGVGATFRIELPLATENGSPSSLPKS